MNIILPRVNNFDIKHKKKEYLFYYMPPTPNKIWEYKYQQNRKFRSKHKFFFRKSWTTTYLTASPRKSFYIVFVDIFFLKSLTHEKFSRIWIFLTWSWHLIRNWREIKQDSHLWRYNNWRHRGAMISSYFT